jgi:hypothetical protein
MFMSLQRHQGASPGGVQPDRGTKRIGIAEGLLTLAAFQGVKRKPVRIVGYRLTSETVAALFPPRVRAAAR